MGFFRVCPECGRRFHVKLLSKRLVRVERHLVGTRPRVGPHRPGMFVPSTRLAGGQPAMVNLEEFQYAYKCTHCEHEWSEKRMEG